MLSPDKSKLLLIHHKRFNKWLQPGGHWEDDGEANPQEAAKREAIEETGIGSLTYVAIDPKHPLVPFDIGTHAILANPEKNEADHWHHDFRYVFVAGDLTLDHEAKEVNAAVWVDFDAPEAKNIPGIIAKLRHFGFITD